MNLMPFVRSKLLYGLTKEQLVEFLREYELQRGLTTAIIQLLADNQVLDYLIAIDWKESQRGFKYWHKVACEVTKTEYIEYTEE